MILYRDNLNEISDMLAFAKQYNIQRVMVWAMEIPKSDPRNIMYHLENSYDMIQKGFDVADKLGVELRVSENLTRTVYSQKTLKQNRCIAPWMYIAVNHNGSIAFCDCRTEPVPNVLKEFNIFKQPFNEIWNSVSYQKIRRAFMEGISQVAAVEIGCSKCCLIRYVDFEEYLYKPFEARIVNNKERTF